MVDCIEAFTFVYDIRVKKKWFCLFFLYLSDDKFYKFRAEMIDALAVAYSELHRDKFIFFVF